MSDTKRKAKMSQRIAALELALQQISEAKKQLYRNTTEAKSRIQCNISRQLEALRNREVWLLNQLDIISGAKEEVLQQQSARLHKTLGQLQSTLDTEEVPHLTRLDLEDIQPEETPNVSFKADSAALREAIMNYGKIDSSSIPGVQSPYVAPDQPAPSLPRHFEDYNDAEHHILYKTVEEINRSKTEKACVYVNIPKLSTKIEDWLLYPSAPNMAAADPKFNFPKLSNNLSDWLKSPISLCKTAPVCQEEVMPLDGISTDASIKTWLHKIKQNPYEEDEDDFEFIEDMSDTRTQNSDDSLDQLPVPQCSKERDMWLYKTDSSAPKTRQMPELKVYQLPMDKWLLPSTASANVSEGQIMIGMSNMLTKVTDELEKWLLAEPREETGDPWVNLNTQTKPAVPSSLCLQNVYSSQMPGADNPWLLQRSTSQRTISPASSTSSLSSISSAKSCKHNKWLLNGGKSEIAETTNIPCPLMDKYKKNMHNTVWLKSDIPNPPPKNANPLANFAEEHTDISAWLKPQTIVFKSGVGSSDRLPSPLKTVLDYHKSKPASDWLLKCDGHDALEKPMFSKESDLDDAKWLHPCRSTSSLPNFENDLVEEEL